MFVHSIRHVSFQPTDLFKDLLSRFAHRKRFPDPLENSAHLPDTISVRGSFVCFRRPLLHNPAFSRRPGPKGSPSVNFAHVRRAYVVESLPSHLPVRLVLIGKPHVRHERI